MKKYILIILLIGVMLFTGACQLNIEEDMLGDNSEDSIQCIVERVVDGDTIVVNYKGRSERLRLIGVNTPETVHPTKEEEPFGQEASDFTKSKLAREEITLEFDVELRDKYGRLLAYVWIDGKMFNETLVREGYAQVATYPPNVKYTELFLAAQKEARDNNRGLWGKV